MGDFFGEGGIQGDCSQHLFMVIKELMNKSSPALLFGFRVYSYLADVRKLTALSLAVLCLFTSALPPHPNNMISLHVQAPA